MKLIDAHTHVFEQLCGFGPRGELRPIGGGKARWANGDEIEMIPPGLGERSFTADTLAALLRENHVERAVLLQGSFYGFQNEYVLESARRYPDLFVPAATCDPFCKEAEYLLHRFIHERGSGLSNLRPHPEADSWDIMMISELTEMYFVNRSK